MIVNWIKVQYRVEFMVLEIWAGRKYFGPHSAPGCRLLVTGGHTGHLPPSPATCNCSLHSHVHFSEPSFPGDCEGNDFLPILLSSSNLFCREMHFGVYKLLDWLLEDEKTSRPEMQVKFAICIKVGIPFPVLVFLFLQSITINQSWSQWNENFDSALIVLFVV